MFQLKREFGRMAKQKVFKKGHKARTFIPDKYQALPHWCTLKEGDPHDYPLRKPQTVFDEIRNTEPFPIQVTHTHYHNSERFDPFRNSKIKFTMNMLDMNLTALQKRRLIELLGQRYQNSDKFSIVADSYPTLPENIDRAFDIVTQLYLEAKRAP